MNTASLKNFAVRSRNILKTGVREQLLRLGFDGEGRLMVEAPEPFQGGCKFMGRIMEGDFYGSWMQLQSRISTHGVQAVCEEAAYTWFNRLVAIRILQKNGFIEPVMQYVDPESRTPVILSQARAGRLSLPMNAADSEELSRLLADPAATREQFAILIKAFCESNPVIYNCFGGIEKYISLLLPDNILDRGGFIDLLNSADFISDDDYRQSELIGWLYQFYISERKDEVFAAKTKVSRDDIPAATQIFTPNWIVRYMVQNTLGRTYLDNNPDSPLREKMEYLVESSSVGSASQQLDSPDYAGTENPLRLDDLAEYKFIDPACGSGHILGEGFELLYTMYMEEFYSPRMAIESIFRSNLLGIDIDTRACQLSAFSLLMKAAQKDSSFLDGRVMPRVLDMPEPFFPEGTESAAQGSSEGRDEALKRFISDYLQSAAPEALKELSEALVLLREARNLGSIMKFHLSDSTRYALAKMTAEWKSRDFAPEAVTAAIPSMDLILALTDRYTAVVANPPYMGSGNMNAELSAYVTKNYPDGKADLATVFVQMMGDLTVKGGSYAFIIPPSWMFLSTFEKLRKDIIENKTISSLLHLSRGVFGADFGSSSAVIRNVKSEDARGVYLRLVERTFQEFEQSHLCKLFELTLADHNFRYKFKDYTKEDTEFPYSADGQKIWYPDVHQKDFAKIPGSPIGYWVSERVLKSFEYKPFCHYGKGVKGLDSGDNDKYVRYFWEVSVPFGKWTPYCSGGPFRRWYGNNVYLLDYESVCGFKRACVRNKELYFRDGFEWSRVSSNHFGVRRVKNAVFGGASQMAFLDDDRNLSKCMTIYNTKIAEFYIKFLNPTMITQAGDVNRIPICDSQPTDLKTLVDSNIAISKQDWDAHETSWDFRENELIRILKSDVTPHIYVNGEKLRDEEEISSVVTDYKRFWESQFRELHDNEEQLNREFISIYGLQDELTPDVPLDEVTILQQGEISISDAQIIWNDAVLMKQLLSYAMGCFMGRYRLDRPGLHIAHPNPTAEELSPYEAFGQTFTIDDDGIIPLMAHNTPFEDDNALRRVVNFVTQVFGEEHLTENLNFIERSLCKSIEDYLVKDFWKDHRKTYQNRPIYWLFTSRKGNFQVLVYMHRMNKYTAERIRTRYLLPYIDFLTTRIASERERGAELSSSERKALTRMEAALEDCREYHDRLHTVAEAQIDFDLDDGVAVNYAKFGDVLAKLK